MLTPLPPMLKLMRPNPERPARPRRPDYGEQRSYPRGRAVLGNRGHIDHRSLAAQGTLLAIDEINEGGGVDGREIVPVRYDPCSDPATYSVLAERLITQDRVNVIFGCYMSSSRKLPVVEKWNKLLFYPTLYEGFEFSNNIIYTGAAPNQNSVQLAEFMTANFGARVYLIGSDYIYPYESNRIMGELVLQRQDSAKLGERYVALNATERDYREILDDIRNKRPDFIFSTVVGNSTACLYRAYADAGFDPKTMPIASLTTSEAELSQMEPAVAAGISRRRRTSSPSIPTSTGAAWSDCGGASARTACPTCAGRRPTSRCTSSPTPTATPAPTRSRRSCRACCKANSRRRRAACASTRPIITLVCTARRPGQRQGQFTIVREATRPVHPDPYLVTHSLGDWTATLSSLEI